MITETENYKSNKIYRKTHRKTNIRLMGCFFLLTITSASSASSNSNKNSDKNIDKKINNNQEKRIFSINQTFGVKTNFYIKAPLIQILQLDMTNKIFASGSFLPKSSFITKENKNAKFFTFVKKYNNNQEMIDVCRNKNNSLLVINNFEKNNEKSNITYQVNNLYDLLQEAIKLDITMGSAPDYFKKENEILLKHGEKTAQLYKLYYASMGKYRVYNVLTYLNEQVNIRMGQILNMFDVPAFIWHSGDGKEIFTYLGIHVCPHSRKIYYGIMVLSFDLLSICRDLFYYIEKCPNCHSNIQGNVENDTVIFKIQKTFSK